MSEVCPPSSLSVILLTTPSTSVFVKKVSDKLTNNFNISQSVCIRSALTPVATLMAQEMTGTILYAAFQSHYNVTCLSLESINPVLVLSSYNDDDEYDIAALCIAKHCLLSGNVDLRRLVNQFIVARRQAILVEDATCRTQSPAYNFAIAACYDNNLQITGTNILLQGKSGIRGKVRDRFENDKLNKIALVTTDRQSGFDRQLALVPYKGAVLNLCSSFWFNQTADIIKNHLIATPHPYVSITKQCKPFPIEFVVRAYMTGSTATSIWKNYQQGVREYCGHTLTEGMTKNQSLEGIFDGPLLTPTTKEENHDRPISCADIIKEEWMTREDLDICANAAIKIFQRGQQISADHGLILVDTKYEFGRSVESNEILLIDEVHTPDSSRYWIANTYNDRIAAGQEPENIDKEFLRLWFSKCCDPYTVKELPDAPRGLVLELSRRYIQLYEMITCTQFDFQSCRGEDMIASVIEEAIYTD